MFWNAGWSRERHVILRVLICALLCTASSSVIAVPTITIDGDLSDWGVTISDSISGMGSNPASDFSGISTDVISFIEDTNDLSNSYQVGPNYGGQNYDAEFLGAFVDSNILYIGISSGQRPDNDSQYYAPGDIYVEIAGMIYGIEVGGGAGGVGGMGHIEEGASGTTYTLNNSGYTTGSTDYSSGQTAGSIWENPTWYLDPIGTGTPPAGGRSPTQINDISSSMLVGTADYVFTLNSSTSQHSIVELAWDLSSLGLASGQHNIAIQWAPSCGNDVAHIDGKVSVPEPTTLALFGAGLLAIPFIRRKRLKPVLRG
jgi:hypothetical protein